ncbi:hypothetical protein WJX74_000762 [Apatococcus lobatus]|uniref:Uncharacterized protein n=1 Tax=Apatococcus lobatus TaxID=904363 RepID=A0AAW1SA75_9CHLO
MAKWQDHVGLLAKAHKYVARSAFKLLQIQKRSQLTHQGAKIPCHIPRESKREKVRERGASWVIEMAHQRFCGHLPMRCANRASNMRRREHSYCHHHQQ